MIDPEKAITDKGWTGDLVPPLAKPPEVEAKKEPDPKKPDETGIMIDVYSNQ